MHLLAARARDVADGAGAAIDLGQTPGDIVVLAAPTPRSPASPRPRPGGRARRRRACASPPHAARPQFLGRPVRRAGGRPGAAGRRCGCSAAAATGRTASSACVETCRATASRSPCCRATIKPDPELARHRAGSLPVCGAISRRRPGNAVNFLRYAAWLHGGRLRHPSPRAFPPARSPPRLRGEGLGERA